jgi:predicted ATPase
MESLIYSFNVVAAMQALASLEMAVKDKTPNKEMSFYQRLNKVFKNRQLAGGISLAKALSKLRNDLAHGSATIHGQGLEYLNLCSQLINELYPV